MWIDTPRKNAQRETEGNSVRKVREKDECVVRNSGKGMERLRENFFCLSTHKMLLQIPTIQR